MEDLCKQLGKQPPNFGAGGGQPQLVPPPNYEFEVFAPPE